MIVLCLHLFFFDILNSIKFDSLVIFKSLQTFQCKEIIIGLKTNVRKDNFNKDDIEWDLAQAYRIRGQEPPHHAATCRLYFSVYMVIISRVHSTHCLDLRIAGFMFTKWKCMYKTLNANIKEVQDNFDSRDLYHLNSIYSSVTVKHKWKIFIQHVRKIFISLGQCGSHKILVWSRP